MTRKILLVDDDSLMRRSLGFNLQQAGFTVHSAASGEEGLEIARHDPPDLILLDINLSGMDGLDTLKHFRSEQSSPVIFVTARRREFDQVLGLELGADDYITKPFDFDVLLARVKAVLRRAATQTAPTPAPRTIQVGRLTIQSEAHTVHLDGRPVDLSPREFDLLVALCQEAGKVVSADDLLTRVWGAEFNGEPQVLYVHIRWLREKLESDPQHPRLIQTVRGVGYRLTPEETAIS